MQNALQQKVGEYHEWRNKLASTIEAYRDWLSKSEYSNALQELRLFDFTDMLRQDRITLALVAEFSRGKTETINALFFADFNQRLLPSEAGRTTMCPTEILWDEKDEPSIKLLPIETRRNDQSLSYLKGMPNAWHKFRLNLDSPDEMKSTLRKLVEQKEVLKEEAVKLGLWNQKDAVTQGIVDATVVSIPVWRHAIINYPHSLLKNGLVVIDTPGLNALGAEPELTIKIIPNANAVLFLTATDTGVTQSDMQIWNQYIRDQSKFKLVLLNKIDTLWDELKSDVEIKHEIDKQINSTARQLGVAKDHVFAISAQKALVAKIKKNSALLEQSGIMSLENALAEKLVQSKQEVIGRTVAIECSEMVKSSRKIMQLKLNHVKVQFEELKSMQGQNRDAFQALVAKAMDDKKKYEASIPAFNEAEEKILRIGKRLLRHLSMAYLDSSVAKNKQQMNDSWTTFGLNQSIRQLMKQANDLAVHVTAESHQIKELADQIYQLFRTRHGFDVVNPPVLNMTIFLNNMQNLETITNEFCNNPLNLLTEKRFLIRKFFLSLGAETQRTFQQAHDETDRWIANVLNTLQLQIDTHKEAFESRLLALKEAQNNAKSLEQQMLLSQNSFNTVLKNCQVLDHSLLELMKAVVLSAKVKAKEDEAIRESKKMAMPDLI